MGYEKVEETVLKEAEAAAAAILAEAKRRQEEELARVSADCEIERREALAEAEARCESETARQVSRARHAGRMQVLDAKNKIIDAVFQQAADALRNLREQQYLDLMRFWLDALPPDCSGVLRVNPSDVAGFTEPFLRSINDKRGPGGFITGVVGDPSVHGGFVIEAEDSTAEQTIDRKIRDLREEMSSELARELFRE